MRMSSSRSSLVARLAVVAAALMLAACQTTTYETASDTNLKPRDKELLAKARYAKAEIPQPYRRAIVSYHRKETPGTIVIDSDNHYLYLVQDDGKALRYGVTVGEEALAFSGIAKVGNMQEWPRWIPDRRHSQAYRRPAEAGRRRPGQSARRPRALSASGRQGHAVPHPRHQPAGIHRRVDFLGLHPHDQRGRDRSLQPREDRHASSSCSTARPATRRSIRSVALQGPGGSTF